MTTPSPRRRLTVLLLAVLGVQCVLAVFPPASYSERIHATLPALWLLDFLYYQRCGKKLRWPLVTGAVVAVVTVVSLLIGFQAHQLGGRLNPLEPLWWLLFMASLGVLYSLLHGALTWLLKLAPTARELLLQPRGWWLRVSRQLVAFTIFAPYLFTAANVHRFKVANATDPQQACGLKYEAVSFRAADDGVALSGWFIPRRGSDKSVLVCHGIGANKGNFLPYMPFLHQAGYNVFIFDFRGHGDSAGHTISFGYYEARDVRGAVAYLRRRPEIKHIVAYAFSMGGSSLLHAMPDLPEVEGVIVDSTFADMRMMVNRQMSILPLGLGKFMVAVVAFYTPLELGIPIEAVSPRRHIAVISPRPLLIVHGLADSLIPPEQARLNFAAARVPKELWLVPDANHIEAMSMDGDEYERRVTRFLRRCMAR